MATFPYIGRHLNQFNAYLILILDFLYIQCILLLFLKIEY